MAKNGQKTNVNSVIFSNFAPIMQLRIEMSDNQNSKAFSMIADIEGDFHALQDVNIPEEIPILPVRNLVLFPGVVSPIFIGRESSLTLKQQKRLKEQMKSNH